MADGAGRLVANDAGDPRRADEAAEAAVQEALAGFPEEDRDERSPVDVRWLGIGLRLGLERPDEARHLLAIIGARMADRGAVADAEAGDPAAGRPADVPTRSALLARSAALPFAKLASLGPEAAFGWAAMLIPAINKDRSRYTCRSLTIPMVNLLADGDPPSEPNRFGAGIVIVVDSTSSTATPCLVNLLIDGDSPPETNSFGAGIVIVVGGKCSCR